MAQSWPAEFSWRWKKRKETKARDAQASCVMKCNPGRKRINPKSSEREPDVGCLFPLVISFAIDTIPEVVEVKKHCLSRQE
jgi:hypothetical protein